MPTYPKPESERVYQLLNGVLELVREVDSITKDPRTTAALLMEGGVPGSIADSLGYGWNDGSKRLSQEETLKHAEAWLPNYDGDEISLMMRIESIKRGPMQEE